MPTLLTLTDTHGTIRGVCGCRPARAEPLFLERYLDEPFERRLSRAIHKTVDRELLVEVGNFACANARAAVSLVALLTGHLLAQQFLWTGFTATSPIRRILHLMGARPLDLGPAEASRVHDCPDFWGRYYSHHPRVMAGYLPRARRLPAFWSMHRAD